MDKTKKWDLATKTIIHADFSRNECLLTKTCRSEIVKSINRSDLRKKSYLKMEFEQKH